jgi:hypothetical protein
MQDKSQEQNGLSYDWEDPVNAYPPPFAKAATRRILPSLPAFIPPVFGGMPGVWQSQHRLLLGWLVVLQAV